MLRYSFCLILCAILARPTSGQIITVSDEIPLRTEFVYDLLGQVGENILVVRDGVNEFDIQAFNKDMSATWLAEKELDSRRSRIVSIIPHRDNFHVVYTDEWKDTMAIKVREYNEKAELQFTDTLALLKKGLLRPKFRFVKSEDRNVFLMAETQNERVVGAFAYHLKERRLLWESGFNFLDYNFREEYRKMLISNRGEMLIIFEQNNQRNRIEEHYLDIYKYVENSEELGRVRIALADFITYDAFFKYDNLNEQLITVGLKSDKNTADTEGIYLISLDANNLTKYQISTISYSDELVADFHGKYNPKKESLYNLDVQDVVLREDGGVLLLAEESKEFERLGYGGRRDYYGSRFSVDYYYEDLILISIHPNGTPHWQKLLPKRQYSNDDQAAYSSYFLFKNPTFLRILYNDEIRNENTVSEYILNGAGDITRRSLMSTDNQRLKLQIKNAVQIANNELILPSVRGKKLKLVRLAY